MKKINWKEVDKGTIARTLILFLGLINAGLKLFGMDILPISDGQINTAVTAVWAVGGALWTWWKNNSFTSAAQAGDNLKNALKEGTVKAEDLEDDIDDDELDVVKEPAEE
ncbi:phage holin [Anaerofustis stercorihominis]|uniref:phage holin n=1 Tax=Anaerofustis stercorihominis TaxID=214853 RepID=UPI0039932249